MIELLDFGCSGKVGDPYEWDDHSGNLSPVRQYGAPRNTSIDIWRFGGIAYELFEKETFQSIQFVWNYEIQHKLVQQDASHQTRALVIQVALSRLGVEFDEEMQQAAMSDASIAYFDHIEEMTKIMQEAKAEFAHLKVTFEGTTRELMRRALEVNPKKRATAIELKQMTYFTEM